VKRSRQIVLVANCILNPNAKVYGLVQSDLKNSIIKDLMDENIGIIQMPCIEMEMCGLRRWGQVREQLDHEAFRNRCRKRLKPIVQQVCDFDKQGYKILGIIGIDGSPACGIHFTPTGDWYGEFNSELNYSDRISNMQMEPAPGIMIQELETMLKRKNLTVKYYALNEVDLYENKNKIMQALRSDISKEGE
jgi:predicted secreted protein